VRWRPEGGQQKSPPSCARRRAGLDLCAKSGLARQFVVRKEVEVLSVRLGRLALTVGFGEAPRFRERVRRKGERDKRRGAARLKPGMREGLVGQVGILLAGRQLANPAIPNPSRSTGGARVGSACYAMVLQVWSWREDKLSRSDEGIRSVGK
jgi:hypothetical protein